MLIDKNRCRIGILELIALAGAVIAVIGSRTWFTACPVSTDMIMSCHWAGQMVQTLSLALLVMTVIHVLLPDLKMKAGADIGIACLCVILICVPGVIIGLCQDPGMACRAHMRPWSIGLGAAVLVIALADMIFCYSRLNQQKHHRS